MATEGPPTCRVQVAEHPRLLKLKEMFNLKFGSIPKFYVRAPGRVNIIGEHIDYCGYSVLPMAVEQDILIAVEPVKANTLQLSNTNPLYPDFSTSANDIQIDKTKPLWHNYFLCGFKGIQEHFGLSNLPGMNCLVDGTIPPSSGLSSSSAVVCCAGLVTITVLGMNLSKVFNNSNSTTTLEGPVTVDRLWCIQPFKGSGEAVDIDSGDAILIWKDVQIY